MPIRFPGAFTWMTIFRWFPIHWAECAGRNRQAVIGSGNSRESTVSRVPVSERIASLSVRLVAAFGIFFGISTAGWSAEISLAPGPEAGARLRDAQPGDVFLLEDGDWSDTELVLDVDASAERPVVLRARNSGKVRLTGKSRVRVSGRFVVVEGLAFENPRPAGDVFEFRTGSRRLATDSILRNCSFRDVSKVDAKRSSRWVSIYGARNRVENCSFAGKSDLGATLVVWVTDVPGEHVIRRNWFGPRPPLGKNGGETIRVGSSGASLRDSRTIVEENYFEECDGEVEIISSKSCGNIFRHNVFDRCSGALTLRHGNRCVVDGNVFVGKGKRGSGGVRVIGEDHRVVNNYFSGLEGDGSRATLSFMNGVPNGELHEYAQVKRALVAFNSVADCKVPMAIGVVGMKTATLPPENCVIANNAFSIRNRPLIDPAGETVGWQWTGNLRQKFEGATSMAGVELAELALFSGADRRLHPEQGSALRDRGQPIPPEFPVPTTDLDGRPRDGRPDVGCEEMTGAPGNIDWPTRDFVGPIWQR